MQLRGSLQYWDWDIQSGTTERTIQGSWTADIRFNALSIEAGYELQRRASPLVNLGSGFRIRLVRRF